MDLKRKNESKNITPEEAKEITEKDIMNLISLKNIKIKDKKYAEEHLTIKRKSKKSTFEVKITDIDGQMHSFQFELKTYS